MEFAFVKQKIIAKETNSFPLDDFFENCIPIADQNQDTKNLKTGLHMGTTTGPIHSPFYGLVLWRGEPVLRICDIYHALLKQELFDTGQIRYVKKLLIYVLPKFYVYLPQDIFLPLLYMTLLATKL